MKHELISTAKELGGYLVLCVGAFLMARSISQYIGFDPTVGFLAFKQDYVHITVWRFAFYIHVFSSLFTLVAGFVQFSPYVLSEHRSVHRFVGRLYAFNVLCINAPVGLVMAIYANGFLPSKLAFLILDALWFWFTLKAVLEIKRGDIASHRRFMIRSFALTFSAVTLRSWKLILSNLLSVDSMTLYMIDAWLGFVPNLLIAEWYVRRSWRRETPGPTLA